MTAPIPHGRTARRLQWSFLPPLLRRAIEARCGTPVVEAISCDAGFTPGLASVLVGADGSRHFVKAASVRAQRPFAEAYREEARTLASLPPAAPAPRLLWTLGVAPDGGAVTDGWEDWVVLGIEHVDAAAPDRPWRAEDLDLVLTALGEAAAVLTPPPSGLHLAGVAEEFAAWPAHWQHPALARLPHAADAAALAAGFAAATAGDTLAHTDVRDDNLLLVPPSAGAPGAPGITGAGASPRVLLCDWNWPVRGAAWLDSFMALVGPLGDGLDVEAEIARRPVFAGVDPLDLDRFLAALTGYFLAMAELPVPPTSPHLRTHQRWQGEVCWRWLAQRRGWADVLAA